MKYMVSALILAVAVAGGGCVAWQLGHGQLNVVEAGADPTGKRDCTELLQRLHNSGRPVHYPNGTYRFNGQTLDFSGGVTFETRDGVVIRNDVSAQSVVVFDDRGNLIGLQHNHLEQDEAALGKRQPVRSGSLVRPPLATVPQNTVVDVVAHWYNDFGLESTRLTQGSGWIGWYYWSWNFHQAARGEYDPARHPLLGYYRGDDTTVLDWQCCWLAEYGVKAVTLCTGSAHPENGLDGWEHPRNRKHWIYQLFHNVPNFRQLKYVMWGPTPWSKCTKENQDAVEAGWRKVIEATYLKYPNFYTVTVNDKVYPVMFLWEEGALRGVFDNYRGCEQTMAFYTRIAERFQAAGFGGVALFARHPISGKLLDMDELERRGVIHFNASYSNCHGKGKTYAERVDSYSPPVGSRTIVNTATSVHTHAPHPSKWVCPGHTPTLFKAMLEKAVAHIQTHDMPRIVTCYNVAEWAEGGPALQPNMKDGFGYLQAVRDVVSGE